MMRGAGKTYSVFDFLLKEKSWMSVQGAKIYYVTRVVGDVKEEGNKGTFYDTEKTIRKIEKKQQYPHSSKFKICMIAGEEKICQQKINLNKSTNKISKYKQFILCEDCDYKQSKTLADDLIQELKEIDTLKPFNTRSLAEKYRICPKNIQKYYAGNIADIVFITYAMLPFWKISNKINPFIIFDEARYFMNLDDITIAEVKSENTKNPSLEECIKTLEEQFIPLKYSNKKDQPDWYKKVEHEINTFSGFIIGKLNAMYKASKFQDESEKEYMKKILEYKPRLVVEHMKEYPPGFLSGIKIENFVDEYIGNLSEEKIRANLHEIVRILINSQNPDIDKLEVRKTIDFLNQLHKIAGCSHIEVEIIKQHEFETGSYKYIINLKPFQRLPKLKGILTFYLDGTPYPPELYEYWIGIEQKDIDIVSLPSKTNIVILYEDVKRSTKDIYYYGNESDSFKRHLNLIKGLNKKIKEIGLKTTIVARTKEVAKILGSNGVKADFVCGDKEGEGVQLDSDVLILEGTQIRNIGVDLSRRFELAKYSLNKEPSVAIREFQNIATLQTMMQSIFRAVDREKRRNIIVLLGNMMPDGGNCWIELAKQCWSYLNEDNVKQIRLNGEQRKDNEIKEIIEIVSNKEYNYGLSPLQNQIIRYVKGRPYSTVSISALVNHFLKSQDVIGRTKRVIFETINYLIDKEYLVKPEEGFVKYNI